jgi:ubiquitin carboxyl-terminal hydrolase 1
MNNRFSFNERDYYDFDRQHRQPRTHNDYLSSATAVLAFILFAWIAYPLFSEPGTLRRYLRGLHDMAARLSFGVIRRPMQGFGSESASASALNSVFGLNSAKVIGADTLQRGIGGLRSIVKGAGSGASSESPAGLGNMNNSCYQNSVIQGLASLRSLPAFLSRVAQSAKEGAGMNEALLQMVQKLNDAGNNGKMLWLPQELKTMSTWQQQDAQEYFSKVLERVDKEAGRVSKQDPASRKDLGLAEAPSPQEVDTEEVAEALKNPLEGMIAQRVGCKTCGHSDGISLIPFNCLTVPLGSQSDLYDVRDCLDEYTKLEEIDGVQCPKCTLLSFRTKLESLLANPTSAEALKSQLAARLEAVVTSLNDDDFSDEAITKKCQIPKKQWIASTKTKQAVVARAPQGLVIHINRSMFNEYTGAQTKNGAAVLFPLQLGLGPWTLGKLADEEKDKVTSGEVRERWSMDPRESMLPGQASEDEEAVELLGGAKYELRAVVTHYGRHENGHYVAYRRHLAPPTNEDESVDTPEESWWCLSDEDVTSVDENFVLRQGGVFMLFYEKLADPVPTGATQQTEVSASNAVPETLPVHEKEKGVQTGPTEAELEAMRAEDEYVLASPPTGWKDGKDGYLPTPPESVVADSELDDIAADNADLPSSGVEIDIAQTPQTQSTDLSSSPSTNQILSTLTHQPSSTEQPQTQEPPLSETEAEIQVEQTPPATPVPAKSMRMRTSSVFSTGRGSSESLRVGTRMVSAS